MEKNITNLIKGELRPIEDSVIYNNEWYSYCSNEIIAITNININKDLLDEIFFKNININISDIENWTVISSNTNCNINCDFSIMSIKEAWVKEFKLYIKTINHKLLIFADPNYDENWIDKEEIIEIVNKIIVNSKQYNVDDLTKLLKQQLYNNLSTISTNKNNIKC